MNHFSRPHSFSMTLLAAMSVFLSACTSPPADPQCSANMNAQTLMGPWSAHIDGEPGTWLLTLAPHPEHLGSLRGELHQGDLRYPVVADLDEGEFTMEESHDGRRIAATWLGTLSAEGCDLRLSGERRTTQGSPRPFTVQRHPTH